MKKKTVKKTVRKPRAVKTDWETLAKRLQVALASEMKDHEKTQADLDNSEEYLTKFVRKTLQLEGVIAYLESRLGNDQV